MGGLLAALALLIVFVVIAAIAGTAFWIWMLVDCATNKRLKDSERIGWLLAIIFTHLLGALIYFFAARSHSTQPVQTTYRPYQSAQTAPPPAQEAYRSYQQGYPAHKSSSPQPHPSEEFHRDEPAHQEQAQLEQPQAMYPPAPPQE